MTLRRQDKWDALKAKKALTYVLRFSSCPTLSGHTNLGVPHASKTHNPGPGILLASKIASSLER